MAKNVLVVDSDKGFSTILGETLNNHADFKATSIPVSTHALQFVVEKPVDLVIIDMGLPDMPVPKLIKAIREAKPTMAIMVIPFIGEDVPEEVKNLGLQGVLPKPFFVGDLPKLVGQAVGLEFESQVPDLPPVPVEDKPTRSRPEPRPRRPAPPPSAPPPPRRRRRPESRSGNRERPAPPPARTGATSLPILPSWKLEQLRKSKDKIVNDLKNLNSEIRAEVILLTAGSELVATAGTMAEDRAQELALLVAESAEAASQAAAFLGERDARFEQSLHEGGEFRLYSYSLGQGVVLSLALGMNVPLGILRHQTKQTGQALMKYIR
ncbi:MAG TPA: response regulator [Chloroflexi bacterium]|nr:response regulator [Chloroflexota bacterium]